MKILLKKSASSSARWRIHFIGFFWCCCKKRWSKKKSVQLQNSRWRFQRTILKTNKHWSVKYQMSAFSCRLCMNQVLHTMYILKVQYAVSGEDILIRRGGSSLTDCSRRDKRHICFHEWTNWNKKTDLKGQHSFTVLLICGGPCHLSSFKQCSGDLIVLWERCSLFSYGKNKYIWVCFITSLIL